MFLQLPLCTEKHISVILCHEEDNIESELALVSFILIAKHMEINYTKINLTGMEKTGMQKNLQMKSQNLKLTEETWDVHRDNCFINEKLKNQIQPKLSLIRTPHFWCQQLKI